MDHKRKKPEDQTTPDSSKSTASSSSKKQKRKKSKKQKKVHYDSSGCKSSTTESPIESICVPLTVAARNFPLDVTEAEVKEFFNKMPRSVTLLKGEGDDYVSCVASFKSHSETRKALRLSGKSLREKHIYVARQANNRAIIRVSGFKSLNEDQLKTGLLDIFKSQVKVLSMFLPMDQSDYLGFGYIYIENENNQELPSEAMIGDDEISIITCRLKPRFRAEIEGTNLEDKDSKTTLKKKLLPARLKSVHTETKDNYTSFRCSLPDIIPDHVIQDENDCWAIALSRAYNTLVDVNQMNTEHLTKTMIVDGIDPSHLVSGDGIDRIKYAIPFMKTYVKEMVIHQRPRGDNPEAFEAFEDFIIELLSSAPVMVSIECLPSFWAFKGKDIYSPADIDIRNFEIFGTHCLLLTGQGAKEGKEFWELMDSNGGDWGDGGFIRIERHKCLIKSVVELKL